MSDKYLPNTDEQSGSSVVTSEEISITKRGISGDKENLIDINETLKHRKNATKGLDPEMGIVTNEDLTHHRSQVPVDEGNIVNDIIANDIKLDNLGLILNDYNKYTNTL